MGDKYGYKQNMEILFPHRALIDVNMLDAECKEKWFNQTLTQVNNSVVRLGVVEGEYHWHKHDDDDEFFFVLSGCLHIDLEDQTITLGPNQGTTISKGMMHRPRAPERTVMLMVETDTIDPIGESK